MSERHPGPPEHVALLHSFVNSLDLRSFVRHGEWHTKEEHLATPADLTEWLRSSGLVGPGPEAGEADLERAHRLRARLRASLPGAATGGGAGPDGGGGLRVDFRLIAAPGRPPGLAPAADGVDGALGQLVLRVLEAVASGDWGRLKMCEAPDCRWVFYDRSRPNRGRWCAPELCGNRMKTRAYRERRA